MATEMDKNGQGDQVKNADAAPAGEDLNTGTRASGDSAAEAGLLKQIEFQEDFSSIEDANGAVGLGSEPIVQWYKRMSPYLSVPTLELDLESHAIPANIFNSSFFKPSTLGGEDAKLFKRGKLSDIKNEPPTQTRTQKIYTDLLRASNDMPTEADVLLQALLVNIANFGALQLQSELMLVASKIAKREPKLTTDSAVYSDPVTGEPTEALKALHAIVSKAFYSCAVLLSIIQ